MEVQVQHKHVATITREKPDRGDMLHLIMVEYQPGARVEMRKGAAGVWRSKEASEVDGPE